MVVMVPDVVSAAIAAAFAFCSFFLSSKDTRFSGFFLLSLSAAIFDSKSPSSSDARQTNLGLAEIAACDRGAAKAWPKRVTKN